MKNGPFCCKTGVRSDVILSSNVTLGRKMKDIIVYGHVLDKNLFRFRKIHPQLAVTDPAKSGLKRTIENMEK
jgi:hypothetical protein